MHLAYRDPANFPLVTRGTSMYYVITKGVGEGLGQKILITFSTESNHKGGGGQKTP